MVKCVCQICVCGRHHCPHRPANITGMGDYPCRLTEYTTNYKEHKLDKGICIRPQGEPLPQGNMEEKTIYRVDYPPHEPKPPCRHLPEVWKKPPGNIEGLTSYKKDYTNKKTKPAPSMRQDARPLNTGKFHGDPTYSTDYKQWEMEPRRMPMVKAWSPPTNKMEGKSTFTRDYSYKEPRPAESFKPEPMRPAEGLFDDSTRYRDEYIEHGLPEKSPREKPLYRLPTVPLDGLTTFKRDYQEKNIPQTKSYAPDHTYKIPEEPIDDLTTFRRDYLNWPPSIPTLHQPEPYKKPPGKMDKDTTHKLAYRYFPTPPAQKYMPKTSATVGGKFNDESSYNTDYKPWKVAQLPMRKQEYIPNTAPFKGISTMKAHYVPHPPVETTTCKPESSWEQDKGPLEDNTMYRLDYTPKEAPLCPAIFLDTNMTPYRFIREEETGHRFYTRNGD